MAPKKAGPGAKGKTPKARGGKVASPAGSGTVGGGSSVGGSGAGDLSEDRLRSARSGGVGWDRRESGEGGSSGGPSSPLSDRDIGWAPPEREIIAPKEQLHLTPDELCEEITKTLTANNPNAPRNVVRYLHNEKGYKLDQFVDQLGMHFAMDGWLMNKGSEEAKRQLEFERIEEEKKAIKAIEERKKKEEEERVKLLALGIPTPGAEGSEQPPGTSASPEGIGTSAPESPASPSSPITLTLSPRLPGETEPPKRRGSMEDDFKTLRNEFNFSERAAQTVNNSLRDRGIETEPPHLADENALATQWVIFDSYMEDQESQRAQREVQKKRELGKLAAAAAVEAGVAGEGGGGGGGGGGSGGPGGAAGSAAGAAAAGVGAAAAGKPDEHNRIAASPAGREEVSSGRRDERDSCVHGKTMYKAVRVVERMLNQNTYEEIAEDYKYWEDASDAFREGEGTLLPLWKFYHERGSRKCVTSICWNPEYVDLFAVGYGSFSFTRQTLGVICCFTLKNPSYPEYVFTTDSGVMSLDFHPQHCSLLAVGLYDGSVVVYDVRNKLNRPIFKSTVKTGKHTDPVWQVRWQEEDLTKALSFFSVSSDGRVSLWTMSKSELQHQDVMELKLTTDWKALEADDDATLGSLAGGCCFDFNRTTDHLFIVGTEEGTIHKCSKAYNSQYLETYKGHSMAVHSVAWNYWHPRVFLSASSDWTVKLWEHTNPNPVLSFDLSNAVGDVAWAPYSVTTFAAVTNDGKVHVFDLAENKHEPMCEQKIVRKAKLLKLAFNPKHPILLVGDDRGGVTSLKLSPNLRKNVVHNAVQGSVQKGIERLNHIMEVALKGEGPLSYGQDGHAAEAAAGEAGAGRVDGSDGVLAAVLETHARLGCWQGEDCGGASEDDIEGAEGPSTGRHRRRGQGLRISEYAVRRKGGGGCGTMTGGAGPSGEGTGGARGTAGRGFVPQSDREMARLRRGNSIWNFVTAGELVGDQSKMHGDRKLRCNFCNHVWQGNETKAARHFTQPKYCKIAGMRVLVDIWNNTGYMFVDKTAQRVQRWMADEGIRDTRSTTGGQRPRADEAERDEMQDFLDAQEGARAGSARQACETRQLDAASPICLGRR
ncbi:hypothetical protein CBR_g56035 [Chara braunii]|uniref:Uncharacterized protein n=1 Tax=Chara braunii TaxID=69332 RepID=A0A388MDJ9_CHABU|nr:hypothetical protein CBR_g56035 [Chara braunii]|eukprot:GBG92562.1 hypothetical protein CBR_g56035 [Chara braunii]